MRFTVPVLAGAATLTIVTPASAQFSPIGSPTVSATVTIPLTINNLATGTVLPHFPVLKPSWSCREFLTLEHGNPSFLSLMGKLPRRAKL